MKQLGSLFMLFFWLSSGWSGDLNVKTGTIIDRQTGRPVVHATILCFNTDLQIKSDNNGKVRIVAFSSTNPKMFSFLISAPSYKSRYLRIRPTQFYIMLKQGIQLDHINFRPSTTLSGRIVDGDGNSLPEVLVVGHNIHGKTFTDKNGIFTISLEGDLNSNSAELWFAKLGFATIKQSIQTIKSTQSIELSPTKIEAANLVLTFEDNWEHQVAKVDAFIEDEHIGQSDELGRILISFGITPAQPVLIKYTFQTGIKNSATDNHLRPPTEHSKFVQVRPGQEIRTTLEIDLSEKWLSVIVSDSFSGKRIPGATVSFGNSLAISDSLGTAHLLTYSEFDSLIVTSLEHRKYAQLYKKNGRIGATIVSLVPLSLNDGVDDSTFVDNSTIESTTESYTAIVPKDGTTESVALVEKGRYVVGWRLAFAQATVCESQKADQEKSIFLPKLIFTHKGEFGGQTQNVHFWQFGYWYVVSAEGEIGLYEKLDAATGVSITLKSLAGVEIGLRYNGATTHFEDRDQFWHAATVLVATAIHPSAFFDASPLKYVRQIRFEREAIFGGFRVGGRDFDIGMNIIPPNRSKTFSIEVSTKFFPKSVYKLISSFELGIVRIHPSMQINNKTVKSIGASYITINFNI